MSLRRGKPFHPLLDDRPRVVRSRPRFRMELHRPGAQLPTCEPLDRAVVERDVCRLATLVRLDGEAVVLARHQHASARALEDGVVRAAVAERELEGLVAGREREQLMTEADAEDRRPAQQATDCCYLRV